MIDTIVLRIHNLSNYPKIYEQYYFPSKRAVTTAIVDETTGEMLEQTLVPALIYHDTNRVLPITHRSSMFIPSSHYSLSYQVNTSKDYLEFNFSIPKYIFTTNIFQFISIYDERIRTTWNELFKFLMQFFRDNFVVMPLLEDVEVNRIDLCYNQFFNSKEDALNYLDKQKELLVRYARSSKNNFRTYDTSLMYITQRYSFKIYHKGTEFMKNDYKELTNSRKPNPKNLPLDKLIEVSDRVLRYEMTFRKSFFNYIFNQYYLSSKEKVTHHRYRTVPVAKIYQQYAALGYSKLVDGFINCTKTFMLTSRFDKTTDLHDLTEERDVTFNYEFFEILCTEFDKKIKAYQLEVLVSPSEIIKRLDQFNADTDLKNQFRRKQLSPSLLPRILTVGILAQFYNIEKLKQYLPKTTFHRMKKDMEKIGISRNSAPIDIPQPRIDYWDYKEQLGRWHNLHL